MRLNAKTLGRPTAIAITALAALFLAPAAMAKDHKPQGQYWNGQGGGQWGGGGQGGGQWGGGGQGGGQWGNGGQWNHGPGGHDWDNHHHAHGYPPYYYAPRYRQPRVIYVPAPVYYAPPPPPVYYQPAPVYYQPQPVYVQPPVDSGVYCTQSNNGAMIGATAGGVIGGVLGNRSAHGHDKWAATAGGSILGVLLGGAIGQTVDSFDRSCAAQAVAYAPVGQPVQWSNQNYGREYQVTPMREYQNGGRYCREYQANANIDGRWQQVHGTACMEPDGSWAVVN